MGAGGDGDGLGGTGIPIIGAKPGILVIYATKGVYLLIQECFGSSIIENVLWWRNS